MSVPLGLSPGRSGFGPVLELRYDSGSGNGPFGLGWHLGVPTITRKTEKGIPRYLDEVESDVFILSGAEDLVPVLENGKRKVDLTVLPGYEVRSYRPRIEGLFARIERCRNLATGEIHWRSISKDNITSLYGINNESRIADLLDSINKTFSWLLSETFDAKGNRIVYEYAAENDEGIDLGLANEARRQRVANRYLKRIRYGNRTPGSVEFDDDRNEWLFEAVFDYGEHRISKQEPRRDLAANQQLTRVRASHGAAEKWKVRPDPFSHYRQGFEVRTYRRCERVLMFHRFDELGPDPYLVRAWTFDYGDFTSSDTSTIDDEIGHGGSTAIRSLLRSVTQTGYRQEDVQPDAKGRYRYIEQQLPPIEFDYSTLVISDESRRFDTTLSNIPVGIEGLTYRLVDIDGIGIAGVLADHGRSMTFTPNLGDGRLGATRELRLVPSSEALKEENQQLADIDGDSLLELVVNGFSVRGSHSLTADRSWSPLIPFRSIPSVLLNNPNLRFADITGKGLADAILLEADFITWFASLGKDGFGPGEKVPIPINDRLGPRLVFADGPVSVMLADMSGDGLVDLVRICNGSVEYWPNLGYGLFGPSVSMDSAPWFDQTAEFDPNRIRLADIDGSGTTDLLYLGRHSIDIYFNKSGNGWTSGRKLVGFSGIDNEATVAVADVLGNGTACLVLSRSQATRSSEPMHYIDLASGVKPHLLTKVVNNLGAQTSLEYSSSTKMYLEDNEAGHPWVTRTSFPVHVVSRISAYDGISRIRFTSTYRYRHPYFDGVEREFHGFAFVEQSDAELSSFDNSSQALTDSTDGAESLSAPVVTRTWFHTGAFLDRDRVSNYFARPGGLQQKDSYHREPGITEIESNALLLPDTTLPAGLTVDEEREACRSLKGAMLRQEVFANDGSSKTDRPYTVTEQTFTVRLLQSRGSNRHAVFYMHPRETLNFDYERSMNDPRMSHNVTAAVDDFGNVTRSVSVAYGRRNADPDLSTVEQFEQSRHHSILSEHRVTNLVDHVNHYRIPAVWESSKYEVTGLDLGSRMRFEFDDLIRIIDLASEIPYESVPSFPSPQKRLIECSRSRFQNDDVSGSPLAWGIQANLGFPYETYELAFTPGLPNALYGQRVTDGLLEIAGYVHSNGDSAWWKPSGQTRYLDFDHFYVQRSQRTPFHKTTFETETTFTYDKYDLLIVETVDPLGNRVTVGERDVDPAKPLLSQGYDYRVLQPQLIMDPNRNRQAAVYDAGGLLVASAVMGKPDETKGDSLAPAISLELTEAEHVDFASDPSGNSARAFLGSATTRIVYDQCAFWKRRRGGILDPAFSATIAREVHVSDLGAQENSPFQVSLVFSDGFGREVQKKALAEPGPVPRRDEEDRIVVGLDGSPVFTTSSAVPRWVGSGWTVFDNKGRPIQKFEPFFSDRADFDSDARIGVSSKLFYDPPGRVVATLHPDHTWEKVVFDTWKQESWDRNDNVLSPDPRLDIDVGPIMRSAKDDDVLPTWYTVNSTSYAGVDRATAERASVHANTPNLTYFDSLGRTFLTVVRNRFTNLDAMDLHPTLETYRTRLTLDIEGNQLAVTDALDRVILRTEYDLLGNKNYTESMEAGRRWGLPDVMASVHTTWDDRTNETRTAYDTLHRPIGNWLSVDGAPELQTERLAYGESLPNPDLSNSRTQLIELCDQAGLVENQIFDFKGKTLRTSRKVAQSYSQILDWSSNVPLENSSYVHETVFDAVGRELERKLPDNTVVRSAYNAAGLLDEIKANLHGDSLDGQRTWTTFVESVRYDAKGRRSAITYGNNTTTTFEYDRLTSRLTTMETRRDPGRFPADDPIRRSQDWLGNNIQSLTYTYDPVGNVTRIHDNAQQRIFFRNRKVDPSCEYEYDSLYRLVRASGREHLGQVGAPPTAYTDTDRSGMVWSAANDGNALARYTEAYKYDFVGNMTSMRHQGSDPAQPGWTRTFLYDEPSLLSAAQSSNRLTSTSVGPVTDTISVFGDGYDPHGNQLKLGHLSQIDWGFRDELRMTQRQVALGGGGERTFYTYDSAGQRVRKVTETAAGNVKDERLYLGGFELFRRSGVDPVECTTVHVSDGENRVALVERRTAGLGSPQQHIRFQLPNHLHSVAIELDENSSPISYEEFSPYGSTTYQANSASGGALPKRYRYTGKERDEESGLCYHGARYYASWLVRWISFDPESIADGPNTYQYVFANPVRYVDRSGTNAIPVNPEYEDVSVLVEREMRKNPISLIADLQLAAERAHGDQLVIANGYMGPLRGLQVKRDKEYLANMQSPVGMMFAVAATARSYDKDNLYRATALGAGIGGVLQAFGKTQEDRASMQATTTPPNPRPNPLSVGKSESRGSTTERSSSNLDGGASELRRGHIAKPDAKPTRNSAIVTLTETYAPKLIKASEATGSWDDFLGSGQTNINPRTRVPDPNRIFSADGTRSIRFGPHEMNSPPTKFHFHQETWTHDPLTDNWRVHNVVQRVPENK
jgi:RHS repeat-associated protein